MRENLNFNPEFSDFFDCLGFGLKCNPLKKKFLYYLHLIGLELDFGSIFLKLICNSELF